MEVYDTEGKENKDGRCTCYLCVILHGSLCMFFSLRNKNKLDCANKPKKGEVRKEQLARQLWKTANSSNERGTEKASQREIVVQDLERIGKTPKVQEKAWKGLLNTGAEQDGIAKWEKGDLQRKKNKKKKSLFQVPVDQAHGNCWWTS